MWAISTTAVCCSVLQCVAVCWGLHRIQHVSFCMRPVSHIYDVRDFLYTDVRDFVESSTHCNTLQHTATHCNTLQHTEDFLYLVKSSYEWDMLNETCQYVTSIWGLCKIQKVSRDTTHASEWWVKYTMWGTFCNMYQWTCLIYMSTLHDSKSLSSSLQHTVTHCNTLSSTCLIHMKTLHISESLIERTPTPRGGFLFTMFPHP